MRHNREVGRCVFRSCEKSQDKYSKEIEYEFSFDMIRCFS